MQTIRANRTFHSAACLAGIVALLITAIVGSRTTAARAEERTSGLAHACASSGAVNAARLPARVALDDCDLVGRTVVSGSVAVTVPAPGHGVGAAAIGENGESELYVTTSQSGVVSISDGDASEATASSAAALLGPGPPEPCDKYAITGCLPPCDANSAANFPSKPRVKQGQPWKFKISSTPTASLTTAEALTEIKAGTKNVINANNSCAMADNVDKTSVYKGTTTGGTGIHVQGGVNVCGTPNQKNVVDFGQLQLPVIGLACTVSQRIGNNPWFITEADIRFRAATLWTTTPDANDCPADTYDLRGVVTHERGHTFGLAHASTLNAPAQSQLTMYPSLYQCSSYARTFGKGDVRALNTLYN